MKSFDLLRYLKKWWFVIMLVTAVAQASRVVR